MGKGCVGGGVGCMLGSGRCGRLKGSGFYYGLIKLFLLGQELADWLWVPHCPQ